MGLAELVEIAKQHKERYRITEDSSYAEKLRAKLTQKNNLTNQECLDLQEEINVFLKSDVPEEDKEMLRGYTESLVMICNAIKEERL